MLFEEEKGFSQNKRSEINFDFLTAWLQKLYVVMIIMIIINQVELGKKWESVVVATIF